MGKQMKIKHYNRMSGKSTQIKIGNTIITLLIIGVLIFVGWSSYTPIYNFIMGIENKENVKNNISSSEISNINSSQENVSTSSEIAESSEESVAIMKEENFINGIYLNNDELYNYDIAKAKIDNAISTNEKINSVYITIKENTGIINFNSKNSYAIKSMAISENANTVEKIIKYIKEKDLDIIGKVNAFNDSLSPKIIPNSQIKYMNTEYVWIDNDIANGGKQWLNPYSDEAQQYIIDIALEAINLGVNTIVFDGVQFPSGYSLDAANYGEKSKEISKKDILSSFAQKATIALENEKAKCLFYVTPLGAFNDSLVVLGGNQLDIVKDNILYNCVIKLLPESFSLNGKIFKKNNANTAETFDLIVKELINSDYKGNIVVQIENDINNLESNINFLKENNINDYILID